MIRIEECIKIIKAEGFKIYGTILAEDAENVYDLDFTEKIAIVMGNENRGLSEEMIDACDKHIYIPMRGMIQSLNVSVATAVILYEAQRQRALKGMYEKSELPANELEDLINDWCDK